MIAIAMNELKKYYGVHPVLTNMTLEINEGERTAIIGRNGCGKTTLFRVISGMESYEGGMLAIRKNARIGYLAQIAAGYPGKTVYEVLQEGIKDLTLIKNQMEALEKEMSLTADESDLEGLVKRYGRLAEQFEQLDGYQAEGRLEMVANGISIPREMYVKVFDTLSGGEKTRVLFALMLISQPDILLLDEPTNHLDIEAMEWLEQYLKTYKGTVLIISHDRYFLDRAVNRIIEIEDGECQDYNGNYSSFVAEKERRLLCEFENYQDQQKKIRQMEEAIKRLKDWGNRGDNEKFFRKAASMQKALDRMEKLDKPLLQRRKAGLNFEAGQRSGKDVLICEGMEKAYGGQQLFRKADFHLRYGERVGIIGPNGSGKSTLIKAAMGMEPLDAGEIRMGAAVQWGYLEQSIGFENSRRTILEAFKDLSGLNEQEARRILAKFLFFKDSVNKRVEDLSGGEKTRLRLALLMQQDINLLILDEPTNHLDIDTREVLEEALLDFEGTLLFISHDRFFLNKLADRLVCIESGKLVEYCGNYDYYRDKREAVKPLGMEGPVTEATRRKSTGLVRNKGNKASLQKAESVSEESLKMLTSKIEDLESHINGLKSEMGAPENISDYEKLQELQCVIEVLERELEGYYHLWQQKLE